MGNNAPRLVSGGTTVPKSLYMVGIAGTSIMMGNCSATFDASNRMVSCGLAASLGAEICWGLGKRGALAALACLGGAYITDANGTNAANFLEKQVPRLIANECDIAYICIGTNECSDTLLSQATIDGYMTQITSGINSLLASGCRPVMINLPPRDSSANAKANVKLFNQTLAKLCTKLNVTYIDLFSKCAQASGDWISTYSSDSIHPTSETAFSLIGESLRVDAMGVFPETAGFAVPAHSSILPTGTPASIGATGPTGYTGLMGGSAVGTHAAESPTGAGTGSQLFPGVAWRLTAAATTHESRGVFRATGGSFPFVVGQRYLYFAWTKVAACEHSGYGVAATKPVPTYRIQFLDASNAVMGGIDFVYCNVGQEWSSWRYVQIACYVPASSEKYNFIYGTVGPNSATIDMSMGGWGAIPL